MFASIAVKPLEPFHFCDSVTPLPQTPKFKGAISTLAKKTTVAKSLKSVVGMVENMLTIFTYGDPLPNRSAQV